MFPLQSDLPSDAELKYRAPRTFLSPSLTATLLSSVPQHERSDDDCPLCLVALKCGDAVRLVKTCRHEYHRSCIEKALAASPKCPVCREHVGKPQGTCPSGTMTTTRLVNQMCAGFEHTSKGTIQISYSMPSGTQLSYHQNPSKRYEGTSRIAYLPDNDEGNALLQRLQAAWMSGLSFTIGTSLTTNEPNSITWTSIHHKTFMSGDAHGFPDPLYFQNCNDDLNALGVYNPFSPGSAGLPPPLLPPPPTNPALVSSSTAFAPSAPLTGPPSAALYPALPCATLPPPLLPSPSTSLALASPITVSAPSAPLAGPPLAIPPVAMPPMLPISLAYQATPMRTSRFMLLQVRGKKPQGTCPSGTMTTTRLVDQMCAGFEHTSKGTIQISYTMPSGTQLSYHQNPRKRYSGTSRTAYLPDNDEGEALLRRLQAAWMSGLSFTIGTSLTTNTPNSITWTSIHHKTCMNGGAHGFPDPLYFRNCNTNLDALDVPPAMYCSVPMGSI